MEDVSEREAAAELEKKEKAAVEDESDGKGAVRPGSIADLIRAEKAVLTPVIPKKKKSWKSYQTLALTLVN
ncbi:unnamed protein product [Knipowitschia caucasica]